MKKIYILFLVITSYTCTAQILLNGRLIHELPAKSSVDTGDLIIVANPTTGKPYKARKNQVVAGANGVTDGDKGDIIVTGSGAIFTIAGSSVQNGKLALMGNRTYKANLAGTTASPQDATSDQVIADLGINLKMAYADTASLSNRINAKQNTLVSGSNIKSVNGNSLIGSGDVTITSSVAWGNITGSNIMLQTDLRDSFEHRIAAGTTGQYWRGDKTWQTLNKAAVGLSNLDNTSDLDKPISNATNAALAGKQAQLVSGTNIKTINFIDLLGSGNITISGGSGGGETLDQTLALGNTTDTNIIITGNGKLGIGVSSPTTSIAVDRDITATDAGIIKAIEVTQEAPIGTEVERVYPIFSKIDLTGGDVTNEVAGVSSLIFQTGGTTNILEGIGTVISHTGGEVLYTIRALASAIAIGANTANSSNYRGQTAHSAGAVSDELTGMQYSLSQSGGTALKNYGIFNSQALNGGANGTTAGVISEINISAGSNTTTYGIKNSLNLSGGTNTSVIGQLVDLIITGGTNSSATALYVKGPNGISGDPTVGWFQSRMSNSLGVIIQAHSSQSQDLFNIYTNSFTELFSVEGGGNVKISPASSGSTALLLNAASGHTGDVMDIQFNGTSAIKVKNTASALITLESTTQGFLPPRMTKTQRDAISSPATGLVIYQTDNTPGLRCYNGTNWMRYTETAD